MYLLCAYSAYLHPQKPQICIESGSINWKSLSVPTFPEITGRLFEKSLTELNPHELILPLRYYITRFAAAAGVLMAPQQCPCPQLQTPTNKFWDFSWE